MKSLAVPFATLLLLAAPARGLAAPALLGEVSFANSCAEASQTPLQEGFALLHNFEYADAAARFQAAGRADPACAMASWGEAMTFNHPVWMEQDTQAARQALARLGATTELRAARAPTAREAAYLHAAETLFFGPGSKENRDRLYAAEMATLHQTYAEDVDATAFYALSLLGTSHDGRDIPTYMRAAAALEEVFPNHPRHPGVLHYLIHSYDDPAHAPLGMRAARLYGTIAANAPHAVHMTSHIFIALGMWDEVIAANDAAIRAVNAKAARSTPYACGHYPEWLVYALLQERRVAEADAAIARCGAAAQGKLAEHPQPAFPGHSVVLSHADMLTRRAIETGHWRPGEAPSPEAGAYIEARFYYAYAQAMAAGPDLPRMHEAVSSLRSDLALLRKQPATADHGGDQIRLQYLSVMVEEASALEQAGSGKRQDAILALREAAAHETGIPVEFGPPAVPKPPFELLGDLLLQFGDPKGAAGAYSAALVRAPGRTLSLRGLLAAQHALGDAAATQTTERLLARYVRTADGSPVP